MCLLLYRIILVHYDIESVGWLVSMIQKKVFNLLSLNSYQVQRAYSTLCVEYMTYTCTYIALKVHPAMKVIRIPIILSLIIEIDFRTAKTYPIGSLSNFCFIFSVFMFELECLPQTRDHQTTILGTIIIYWIIVNKGDQVNQMNEMNNNISIQ